METVVLTKEQIEGTQLEQFWAEMKALEKTMPNKLEVFLRKVCLRFNVDRNDLNRSSRKREYNMVRRVFSFLAKNVLFDYEEYSLSTIAHMVGNREHSTSINQANRFIESWTTDKEFRDMVYGFIQDDYGDQYIERLNAWFVNNRIEIIR